MLSHAPSAGCQWHHFAEYDLSERHIARWGHFSVTGRLVSSHRKLQAVVAEQFSRKVPPELQLFGADYRNHHTVSDTGLLYSSGWYDHTVPYLTSTAVRTTLHSSGPSRLAQGCPPTLMLYVQSDPFGI
jgi:hypothetical protein